MADRYSRNEGGRWRNEYERSFTGEQHHDAEGGRPQGSWQYGSQGSLRDNQRWQNQSDRGWQGGRPVGRSGQGYGPARGYGAGGYISGQEERYSGYTGSNYGYGRSGTPGTYEGGGYARDPYYAPRHPEHEYPLDNPEWEHEREAVRHARWGGEGYGGPIDGPHFADTESTRRAPVSYARPARRPDTPHWPKSYQRSDERIREDIYERLLQDSYVDCSNVTVVVSGGVVTLEGTVPERHMKHQVENIADGCTGVKDIDNKLRVSQIDRVHPDDGVASGVRSTTPEPTTNFKKP